MSPKIYSVAAGLTALGLSLSATLGVADEPPPLAPSPAPFVPPSPARAPTVLLLSNGQVFHGPIVEDDNGYLVKHKFGTIHKRRREVEGAFATLEEAYQYKLKRTPPRDPAERMKLARWCLDQKLSEHALEQLKGVVTLDPGDPEARAMLISLNASADRAATLDPQVARTSGVADDAHEPGMLNLDEVRRRKSTRGPVGPPVILDLPPPLAVRRYQEFAKGVHPILQQRCAKCHNETSRAGGFQLIQARTRHDLANDLLLRTNLDATMALINGENPSDSRLLNLAFKPHSPTRQPLFTGPNDPSYRVVATWVNSLQLPRTATAPASGFAAPPVQTQGQSGAFAASRTMPQAAAPRPAKPSNDAGDAGWPSPTDYPTEAPADANFQTVSPLLGGPNAATIPVPANSSQPQTTAAPGSLTPPGGQGPQYLRDPRTGNLIIDPVTKQPIPIASRDRPTNRKPKTFDLDAGRLQNMLGRPR
ncbi:MAG: hypothetical protein ABI353_15905 [Isosphaeraceae bacterium]